MTYPVLKLRQRASGMYDAHFGMHYVQVKRVNSRKWRFLIDSEVSWISYPTYERTARVLETNLDMRHAQPYACNCLPSEDQE